MLVFVIAAFSLAARSLVLRLRQVPTLRSEDHRQFFNAPQMDLKPTILHFLFLPLLTGFVIILCSFLLLTYLRT